MPKFEHMRISLAREVQASLFPEIEGEPLPRNEYLMRALKERRDFMHKQRRFVFDPLPMPDGYAGGFFSKEGEVEGRRGPDSEYQIEKHPNWELSLFIIDLSSDSQIAAMQFNLHVGGPRPVLDSFFREISRSPGFHGYTPHILYIQESKSYWEAVDKYKGEITKLIFTFIPLNAFKAKEKVAIFLQEAATDSNSDTSKHIYESKSGRLNPHAELLEASAEVAMEGAGETTVKVGRKTVYTSTQGKTETDVDKLQIPTPDDISGLPALISRIFGKKI